MDKKNCILAGKGIERERGGGGGERRKKKKQKKKKNPKAEPYGGLKKNLKTASALSLLCITLLC